MSVFILDRHLPIENVQRRTAVTVLRFCLRMMNCLGLRSRRHQLGSIEGIMTNRLDILTELPVELVEHILSYLNFRDLSIASMVCRNWRLICCSHHIWKKQALRLGFSALDPLLPQLELDNEPSTSGESTMKSLCTKFLNNWKHGCYYSYNHEFNGVVVGCGDNLIAVQNFNHSGNHLDIYKVNQTYLSLHQRITLPSLRDLRLAALQEKYLILGNSFLTIVYALQSKEYHLDSIHCVLKSNPLQLTTFRQPEINVFLNQLDFSRYEAVKSCFVSNHNLYLYVSNSNVPGILLHNVNLLTARYQLYKIKLDMFRNIVIVQDLIFITCGDEVLVYKSHVMTLLAVLSSPSGVKNITHIDVNSKWFAVVHTNNDNCQNCTFWDKATGEIIRTVYCGTIDATYTNFAFVRLDPIGSMGFIVGANWFDNQCFIEAFDMKKNTSIWKNVYTGFLCEKLTYFNFNFTSNRSYQYFPLSLVCSSSFLVLSATEPIKPWSARFVILSPVRGDVLAVIPSASELHMVHVTDQHIICWGFRNRKMASVISIHGPNVQSQSQESAISNNNCTHNSIV